MSKNLDEKYCLTPLEEPFLLDSQNAALSTAIIAMAHGLGLKVVAEGVETAEKLAFLLGNDCKGTFTANPCPSEL